MIDDVIYYTGFTVWIGLCLWVLWGLTLYPFTAIAYALVKIKAQAVLKNVIPPSLLSRPFWRVRIFRLAFADYTQILSMMATRTDWEFYGVDTRGILPKIWMHRET